MSDPSLSFSVKVGTDGLVSGLKIATTSVEQASALMREGLAQIGAGARETSGHSEGLMASLRELKSEATSTGRTANFFATQLTEIIPGADGAGAAIKKLISIGLEGFTLGAGIEAAVLVLGALNEHLKEHEIQMQKLREIERGTWFAAVDGLEQVQRSLGQTQSKTEAVMQAQADSVRAKLRQIDADLTNIAESTGQKLREFFSGFTFGLVGEISTATKDLEEQAKKVKESLEATKEIARVQQNNEFAKGRADAERQRAVLAAATSDEISRIRADLEVRLAELRKRGDIDEATKEANRVALEQDAAKKIQSIRAEGDIAFRAQALALSTEMVSDRYRIEEEGALKIIELQQKMLHTNNETEKANLQTLIDLEKEATERKQAAAESARRLFHAQTINADNELRRQRLEERLSAEKSIIALEQELNDQKYSAQFASAAAAIRKREQEEIRVVQDGLTHQVISAQQADADIARIHKKASDDRIKALADEQMHFINDFVRPIESSFRTAIQSMINGTKSFTDALKGLLASLGDAAIAGGLKALGEQVVKALSLTTASTRTAAQEEVTQQAGVAFARAYAAMVGIPLVGPALAAEAGAAAWAATIAGGMPSASAAGGYDIPMGINPIVQAHQNETIIPAPLAERYRRGADLLDQEESGGGDGPQIHLHGAYIDAASVRQFVSSREFRDGWREAVRNGVLR